LHTCFSAEQLSPKEKNQNQNQNQTKTKKTTQKSLRISQTKVSEHNLTVCYPQPFLSMQEVGSRVKKEGSDAFGM
jgi:hypothetical protein